jgi:multicomponent Na+:H+ antiporter subunit C
MSAPVYVAAVWLLVVGLYGVVTSRNLVHLVGALSVAQASTYLLLLGVGYRDHAEAPIFSGISPTTPVVDPIVQALSLTDIVVQATVTALLLALTVQARKRFGTVDPDRIGELSG